MKNLTLLLTGVLVCFSSFGQKTFQQKNGEGSLTAVLELTYHGISTPLGTYVEPANTVNEITKTKKVGYHVKDDWGLNPSVNPNALPNGEDPVLQKSYPAPAPPTKTLTQGWDGMGYSNVEPADPSMDVGPNHVVQMINGGSGAYIQIYSKTGTTLAAQTYFDNWLGFPGGQGDPIVMYDERADRWFLSEFSSSGNNLYIAVSTSPDPTGTYHVYTTNSPGGFPDYPKYSIWEDAYVMTANVNTPDIFAFDRNSMLTGGNSNVQMFSQTNFGTIGFQASTPVSLNGTTLPPSGQAPLLMRMRDDAWAGSASDALEMWELSIDWNNSANSSLTQVQTIATAPHETELCGYTSFSCIPQPGTSTALDPLRELLMNRIHYRNFGTHESIVCCHVTDVNGSDHAGIRWYELRRTNGTSGTWSIYQQGTYAPDADHRWMPSIGISATGNIGLAYSVSSSSTFPSLRYTGRKECDPLGSMTEAETSIVAGGASNGSNRWGDYFQMGTDPSDGETFWFTGCYVPSSTWQTRIAAFELGTCSPSVSFGASTASVNETDADQANGCLDYTVLNIPISIASDPSQAAGVTVNVTGGTATENVDYAVQNNTFSFDGSTLSGNVVIHVYDDNYIEGAETITLDYTLNANGGDAVAGAINQTVTITINDDDLSPSNTPGAAVTVFSHDFESGLAPMTTSNPAAPNVWAVGTETNAASANLPYPGTNTTQIAWVNDDTADADRAEVNLELPAVDLSGVVSGTLNFDSYFFGLTYSGATETLVLEANSGSGWTLVGAATPGVNTSPAWVAQSFDITSYCGNSSVDFRIKYGDDNGWVYGAGVDNIVITGQSSLDIQQAVNTGSGMTANLGPNGTVYFYDPTSGDVMMSLENTSSFDYGCVTVEVDRAGTAAEEFNSATTADYLMSKTFRVVPTNNNPSGTFNITVYYKEAEVAGWETATGNSRSNAEIIKVAGSNAIDDVTPANAGSYTINNSVATLGAFNGDVTFTAPFSTGFSGFGVGIYGNTSTGTPPVADFSATPTTICAGETVSFTDLSTNTPTSWSWDFGDTGTSTNQNPTHTYTTPGTYSITLTATNADGSDSHTITNYITVNAIPTVSTTGSTTICEGASITISASGATTYTWDQGLGSGASHTVSPSSTTTYTVTGTTSGCSNTDQVTITVTPLPTVTATGSTTICSGQTTTISASGATTYSWDQGIGSGSSQIVGPTSTTTYTVTGTTSGCSNSDNVIVTVNPQPAITIATANNPTACATSTGSIEIGGTGMGNLSWTGTATGNASGVTLPYTINGLAAGSYTIEFTSGGCTSNTLVQSLSDPSSPSIVATGTTTICAGETVSISASGATTYSWDQGVGSGASHVVSPGSTTTYTVTGTLAGCTGSDAVTITVNPIPNVVATGSAIICNGASTTISASGATSYSWDQGLGAGTAHTVSPVGTTTYTVTGTMAGCTNTDNVTVTVTPQPTISVLNANNPSTCGTATGSIEIGGTGTGDLSWSGSATGSVTGISLPYTLNGLMSGSYSVTFTDMNGCISNSLSESLTDPSAPTVTASGTTTICEGESTVITASGATTYTWDQGLGSGSSQTVSPLTTTIYTVTGTTAGCSNTSQVTVTVQPQPTVVASGASSICEGNTATISATGATTYDWDQGLGSGATHAVSPASTTTYTVTGTTAGCSATDAVTITVNALPVVSIAPASVDTMCTNHAQLSIVGTPSGGTLSGTGVTGSQFNPGVAGAGSHTITYSYVDGNGCQNTIELTIVVEDCAGIKENALSGVELFPNPNNGHFTIKGLEIGTDMEIYDDRGRLVFSTTVASEEQEVEMPAVQVGAYYLKATANGQKGGLKFLIIE